MKRIGLAVFMVIAVISLLVPAVAVLADDSEEFWHPSIADKKLHPDYLKPFESSTPVPKSEIAHITIPKDWLLENDMEPNPSAVTITFPERWARETPGCAPLEDTVELCVPKRMLADANCSKNPSEFSVTFPNRYFKGLEVPANTPRYTLERDEAPSSKDGVVGIDYGEYRFYLNEDGYDHIVGARGTVVPYTYRNEDEEDFVSYHEIEFWGGQPTDDRDYVEIISQMRGDETQAKVWFAIYVDGNTGPEDYIEMCSVEVDIGDECYWEFYSKDFGEEPEEDEYHMFWLCYEDEWYWDVYYDETPPTYYHRFGGAAELDVLYLPDDDYRVNTYDIHMDGLMVEVDEEDYEWQDSDYIQDALDYWTSLTDDNVQVSRYLDWTGLYFSCSSYD